MNKKQTIMLNESQLRRIVKESVNRMLNEEYGVDFEDTLRWVQKKFPEKSPQEQERFARNIINKKNRANPNGNVNNKPKEKPSHFRNIQELFNYYGIPYSKWTGDIDTCDEYDLGDKIVREYRWYETPIPTEYTKKTEWNEFKEDLTNYLEDRIQKGNMKIHDYQIVEYQIGLSENGKYVWISLRTDYEY